MTTGSPGTPTQTGGPHTTSEATTVDGADQRPRVLCVDDEPAVLRATRRVLATRFNVTMAVGGLAALDAVRQAASPFAVVVTDLRMPELNGIGLLQCVRQHAQETTRVLLTGNADVPAAVDAVNAGEVFRFLTKPCPPESLIEAVSAACAQHDRALARASQRRDSADTGVVAEHSSVATDRRDGGAAAPAPVPDGTMRRASTALPDGPPRSIPKTINPPPPASWDDKTLGGYVGVLRAVLSDLRPLAADCAARIEHRVGRVLDNVHLSIAEHVKAAAALSQIGSMSMASDVAERIYGGWALSADDRACAARIRARSAELIAASGELAVARRILLPQSSDAHSASGAGTSREAVMESSEVPGRVAEEVELGARILDIALMLDEVERRGTDPDTVALQIAENLSELERNPTKHDGLLVDAFRAATCMPADERVRTMRLRDAHAGMALAADIVAPNGLLVARRGQRIGDILAKRTTASWSTAVLEQTVQVIEDSA